MTPKVSIIIPSYNSEDTIVGAVESARRSVDFCQRYQGLAVEHEIAVVDDGSGDGTLDVLNAHYRDADRVIAIRNPENRGAGYSRNEGVRQTEGEYIFFLDADDLFLDNHIHACLSRLLGGTHCGFARSRVVLAEDIHPSWHGRIARSIPITLCVRRSSHEFIGGFFEDPVFQALRAEDDYYQNLLSVFFRCMQVPEKTVYYSRRPGNAFDRQFSRFCAPPGSNPDSFDHEQKPLVLVAQQIFQKRVEMLYEQRARPAPLVA